ncbi:facilitated trehalose transporter Tret1-like [Arctopsyche grandis]|uniref:facilitated trehalose transporter Tret1-like n=1 Tax=Arctopsyche grandis TaxID=121162 RepID=UPI00406D659C
MSLGSLMGWTSPSLEKLSSKDSHIPLNSSQLSWVASLVGIGGPMAAIPCAYLLNKIGRKPVILGAALAHLSGWVTLIFATEAAHLYLGRFLLGAAAGSTYCSLPLYIGEMVDPKIRGTVLTFMLMCHSMITLVSFVVGSLVSFKTFNMISAISPVLMLIAFTFAPETPFFLMRKGRKDEAVKCLMMLKGSTDASDVNSDVKNIEKFLEDSNKCNFAQSLRQLMEPKSTKAVIIVTVLLMGQQFSGVSAIVMYMSMMFDTLDLPISSMYVIALSELLSGFSILISSVTVDRFGRKPLFALSSLICIGSHIMVGLFFFFKYTNLIGNEYSLIVMFGVFLLRIGYELGLGPVPTVVISEILSFNVKGIVSAYFAFIQGITLAVAAKMYQIITDSVGQHCVHWIFSSCTLLSAVFIIFYMPETKNKTFLEIQEDLDSDKEEEKFKSPEKIYSIDVYRVKEAT